jgi:hypothetical protein
VRVTWWLTHAEWLALGNLEIPLALAIETYCNLLEGRV